MPGRGGRRTGVTGAAGGSARARRQDAAQGNVAPGTGIGFRAQCWLDNRLRRNAPDWAEEERTAWVWDDRSARRVRCETASGAVITAWVPDWRAA